MRVARLILVSLAIALAVSGCMRKRAPRPAAVAAPAQPTMAQPAPMPPPVVMAPPEAPPAAGPQSAMAAPGGPALVMAEPAYVLGSGDKLRVVVFGQDGLSNSYTVDAAGRMTMPLIGPVPARGHTTAQLAGEITAKLKNGYVREPHVAVEIEAYRPFFILGEVTYPGQYPYVANMTAETAVAIAGGFTPRAFKGTVTVTRQVPSEAVRNTVPLDAPVRPGDTIVVTERWL
jgi:polysaccharide biosynthesis/export protein